jgi:hypothetical protein
VLYIFSDAAKPGDENMVLKVRKYAQSINGFKKVNLVFQKQNNLHKNVTEFMRLPLELNGKSIILEDDVIVQKSFLKFMNLSLYRPRLKKTHPEKCLNHFSAYIFLETNI